jgi:sarcosine oxidase gamma subunit
MNRRTLSGLIVFALVFAASPAIAQPAASLSIARIFHNGALQAGNNTFRVTVRNTSSTKPILPREEVIVTLLVLDAQQKETTYEAKVTSGIGTNGDQTAAFPNVVLSAPGAYTVTARARTNFAAGRANAVAPDKTEVFNVGGAQADAANQLLVLVKRQATNVPVGGVRVSAKVDGREIDWKQTTSAGEARFMRLAPSPEGKPYLIEVKLGANVLGTFDYLMPAQASTFEVTVP